MGASLKKAHHLVFFTLSQLLFFQVVYAQDQVSVEEGELIKAPEYYQYWNPYRRVVSQRGEAHTFFGKVYYEVSYNKDNRIKAVTKYGEDRKAKETYHFIWSRSGIRSEYKVEFHTDGRASRLDTSLYSDQLSYVRPGWIADVTSRSDGRPREVDFYDPLGMNYFSYTFNYTTLKKDKKFSEVIESSYFDSNYNFVGRHLLFIERGAFLRMIQYFNSENKIFLTKEFLHDKTLEETIRVVTNEKYAGYASKEKPEQVEFYVTNPVNKDKATFGNGTQISFLVNSKDLVNNFYNAGIKLGGKDEGAPGIRSGNYYCYIRDLDENKVCAFTKISE